MVQRSKSRKDVARIRAEEFRNDLGIIDDIYDMYTDKEKKQKHEAEVPKTAEYGISFPLSTTPSPAKRSRSHRRITRKHTTGHGANQGVKGTENSNKVQVQARTAQSPRGHTTDHRTNDIDFNQWLRFPARQDVRRSSLQVYTTSLPDQSRVVPVTTTSDVHLASQTLSELPDEGEQHRISAQRKGSEQKTPAHHRAALTGRAPEEQVIAEELEVLADGDTESRISLAQLRNHLQVLMDDAQSVQIPAAQRKLASQPSVTSSCGQEKQSGSSSNKSESDSSQDPDSAPSIDHGITNLQRIEIEWKGKRYPVLIGEYGKLWEAPCTTPNCTDHGRH